jgi:5-methyltetrahydropteroyltriglutamate--homocysteine methyltransferase
MRGGGNWQGRGAELAREAMQAVGGGGVVVGAKVRQVRRLAEDSAFLKAHAPGPWKMTIPSVTMRVSGWFREGITDKFYATRQDLMDEFVGLVRGEIAKLIEEGCSYFQLDSLFYVIFQGRMQQGARFFGQDLERMIDEAIAIDNATLAGFRGTPGLTIGLHMCRGNNRSAWATEGSYEACAEKAFQQLNVDRFLLEYDTERAGGFEPLRFMPKDKMVVLGLISSKEPALETVDELRRRIDEAAKYVPIESLAISPQCGFASTDLGNLLTWDEQRRKLELIAETARAVWG